MRIAMDLTALTEKPTGISRVSESVAKAYIRNHPEHEFFLLFRKRVPKRFSIDPTWQNVKLLFAITRNEPLRLVELPLIMKRLKVDWILCCAFPGPLLLNDKRVVSIVHDLTPFKFGQTMARDALHSWQLLIKHAIQTNGLILHDSYTVAREVQQMFHSTNSIPIHLGVDIADHADTSVLERFSLEKGSYILSVSTLEPRKNLRFLLKAYSMLENPSGVKLVLTGARGWRLQDAIGQVNPNLEKNIVFTDYVTDQELRALYQNARCFVSSSVYEGFGLPVIEAVKNDLPVLISDIPVYREITDCKAIYFDLDDPEHLTKCLERAITEDLRDTEQFALLKEFAARYTWDNYVERLDQVLLGNMKENG